MDQLNILTNKQHADACPKYQVKKHPSSLVHYLFITMPGQFQHRVPESATIKSTEQGNENLYNLSSKKDKNQRYWQWRFFYGHYPPARFSDRLIGSRVTQYRKPATTHSCKSRPHSYQLRGLNDRDQCMAVRSTVVSSNTQSQNFNSLTP